MASAHHPVLARFYDVFMLPTDRFGIRDQRVRLTAGARGRILEVGVGTGLNLAHYPPEVEVDAIDPDPFMLRRAEPRAAKARARVTLHRASVEHLPFPDDSFDGAVSGLALCTIRDPQRGLDEIARVLKQDAPFYFLEHVRSPRERWGRWQDRLAPLWGRVAGGCRPNQDTRGLIEGRGFAIEDLWVAPHGGLIQGRARYGTTQDMTSAT